MAVLVTQVPDTTTKIKIGADGKSIDEEGITWILNPYAEFALEKALKIGEARSDVEEVVLISMGPKRTVEALRQGLAMGADRAILIKSDVINTDEITAQVKELGADLILGGKKSIDSESSWIEAAVAAKLDVPLLHNINRIDCEGETLVASREVSGETQSFEVATPSVITCDKGDDEPRYASMMGIMKAKKKQLDEQDSSAADNLGIEIVEATLPAPRSEVKIIEGETAEEKAEKLITALRDEAKVL